MIHLMHKQIDPDAMPILYDTPFSPAAFAADFEVRDGDWRVEDGWLIGESRRNFASMAIMRRSFFGPVCLDFRARVLEPCTHDINCMWSGSWDEATNTRALAYVAGIGGWWDGKVGFEKSPEYRLNCGTKLLDFRPGRTYHMQCGSIGGHVFVVNDQGEKYLNAVGVTGYPFFGQLILDCLNRTENAMTQEHAFKAAELSLKAQAQAARIG